VYNPMADDEGWFRHSGNSAAFTLLLMLSVRLVLVASVFAEEPSDPVLTKYRTQGAGLYENQDYAESVPLFEKCVEMARQSAADRINLGLAYYRTRQWQEAVDALETARGIDPSYPHVAYTLGLICKKNESLEAAARQFEEVIAVDPAASSAYYNLGVALEKMGRDEDAEKAFQATVRHNPDHVSAHYYLFKYAKAAGRGDEAKREMKEFSRLQKAIPDKQRTEEAYEESRYLAPIIPPHQSFMPAGSDHRNKISFVDVTAEAGLPKTPELNQSQPLDDDLVAGGHVYLVDLDADNDLDLYLARCGDPVKPSENRLYLNDGFGKFIDATDGSGAGGRGCGGVVAPGDFDNNGTVDLFVFSADNHVLLSNDGAGHFTEIEIDVDVTESAATWASVFVDYDHDGDLDLATANPGIRTHLLVQSACRIIRNNGDSSFSIVADSLWPGGEGCRIALGDFDDDDDTDLLVVIENGASCLLVNKRQGRFDVSQPFGTDGAYEGDVGDIDNDGDLDVILVRRTGAYVYLNDGRASFAEIELPALSVLCREHHAAALDMLDYDNDGLLDVLAAFGDGTLTILANNGSDQFESVSGALEASNPSDYGINSLAAGDIDGDGDMDIVGVYAGGWPFVVENRGGEEAHWLEVQPVGVRVPKQGTGAKIEIKSGPYYQRRDVHQWPVHFGLGEVDHIDVLRITWTNGIVQNMLDVPIDTIYRIEEIVRADASCPFLFAFDGQRFNFVNDILGVAAMGVPLAENFFHTPDPDEYVKIDGDLLAPSDERYLLRLAGEFKELVYLDQIKLIAVDHPIGVDVYPNERFTEPPFMEPGIHTVKNKRYPVAASDWRGRDILPLITRQDQIYPSDIPMSTYDGLAKSHWFEFDLGDLSETEGIMLYLTGWIYWSSASANVAISQNGQVAFEAVGLSVPNDQDEWVQVIDDIGLPNGKNSTIPVDLSGLFPTNDYRILLRTNMVVYWDELFFTVDEPVSPAETRDCDLLSANLHYRGFSHMRKDSIGAEFFDYHRTTPYGPWRQHVGHYTRFGDVGPLLSEADDRYVIYGPGEEIAFEFDAASADGVPVGWTRDFFLYAFGWIKDGDLNTVHSETVGPLPFIGMPGYPYQPSDQPRAAEIARDLDTWLTRGETQTIEPLRQ